MNRNPNAILGESGALRRRLHKTIILLLATSVFLGFAATSCRTVKRVAVTLPHIPGAEYIGTAACAECHEEMVRDFHTADHAALLSSGPNALPVGCESCHGPSSLHSNSGGEVKPPYSFTVGRPGANELGATVATPNARAIETVCFTCHANVRGEFNLPHRHPVLEGRMTCIECHPPHKGSAHLGGSTALKSQDATCLKCHPAQHGPFVFEHEAMREGCLSCHGAHGTVNPKMLTARDSNLCLKCHFQQVQGGQILIGGANHTTRIQQGSCWIAGCHEAVHGSRVNSSLRY
jgi:predicted CXXCH cytochrome family protein